MGFSEFLASFAPGLAARRMANRARLAAATRLYEAVQSSTYRPRRGSAASADVVMDQSKGRLREYGRWLDENHDLATGVLDDMVSNIVGTGVGIEPMVRRTDGEPVSALNDEIRNQWADFWRSPELTGEIPGRELERLICRSWLRDGEVFVQHVTAPLDVYPGPVDYLLQAYESDWVPFDLINGRDDVVHGIQKDRFGRPRTYFFYSTHPGNYLGTSIATETIAVSAANVAHIKFARRLHQTRGVSIFHSVMTRLDDLKDYEESERIAARVAAAFSAYVKRGNDYDPTLLQSGEIDRTLEMSPGMIFDNLLPGEEIGTIDPNRPNNDVANYIAIQERRIAAGTGSRRSAIGRDYNGTYSAQRQELVEGAVHYRRLFSYLAEKFYLPVWRRWVDAARLAGVLRVPPDVDLRSLYRPELRQQPLPWIDPKKEVEAHGLAVEYGFRSRAQVIRDLGGDPREVDAQLAADDFDVRPSLQSDSSDEDQEDGEDTDQMEDAA